MSGPNDIIARLETKNREFEDRRAQFRKIAAEEERLRLKSIQDDRAMMERKDREDRESRGEEKRGDKNAALKNKNAQFREAVAEEDRLRLKSIQDDRAMMERKDRKDREDRERSEEQNRLRLKSIQDDRAMMERKRREDRERREEEKRGDRNVILKHKHQKFKNKHQEPKDKHGRFVDKQKFKAKVAALEETLSKLELEGRSSAGDDRIAKAYQIGKSDKRVVETNEESMDID